MPDCPDGTETCPCYGNNTCNDQAPDCNLAAIQGIGFRCAQTIP